MARKQAPCDSLACCGPTHHGATGPWSKGLVVRPYRDIVRTPQERYPHRFRYGDHCVLCGRFIGEIESDPCPFWTEPEGGPGNDVGTRREREGNEARPGNGTWE